MGLLRQFFKRHPQSCYENFVPNKKVITLELVTWLVCNLILLTRIDTSVNQCDKIVLSPEQPLPNRSPIHAAPPHS